MRDTVRRALALRPDVAMMLLRRGFFIAEEKAEFLQALPKRNGQFSAPTPGPVQFATLLAQGDTHLAADAVLRNVIRPNELNWLYRLLRFRESNDKHDELTRIVERALEGRKGNARKSG
jgi:hypothetical protein